MVEQYVQEIMDVEAFMEGNPYFDSLPVHKEDEDVDTWFGMAVQASCYPCLHIAGMLQMLLCWCLLHAT